MAEIVLGIGTSHSPMLALDPEDWAQYASRDTGLKELCFPPEGIALTFDEAREYVPEEIRNKPRDLETFRAQADACQAAIAVLADTLKQVDPDVLVIVSDDQDEWLFEGNMPSLAIYWGDTARIIPRVGPFAGLRQEAADAVHASNGDVEFDVPVPTDLGRHAIDHLMDHNFDVAHMRYMEQEYGGAIARRYPTRDGELDMTRTTPPRPKGLPHGFSFVTKRLLDMAPKPTLPVFQNTCYPPNEVRPPRAYDFGHALGQAIRSWESDARVAVVASGGLSHFVVDEETDRGVLDALRRKDADALRGTPRHRLRGPASETLNWIAVGGVFADSELNFETVDYVPVYRSEVGSGGGWAFGRWI